MRASPRLLAAVVLVLCGLPQAGASAAGFAREGATAERIASDGVRYVAYTQPDGMTHVIDGLQGKAFEVATPPGCDNVAAIGGRLLAWSCTRSNSWSGGAMLLSLRTRAVFEPRGIQYLQEEEEANGNFPGSISWHDVGSHWLLGTRTSVAHSASEVSSVALNWRTGETRRDEPAGRTVIPDPDRAGLSRKLCAPLRRQARTTPPLEDDTPPFLDFQYTRPFGVAQVAHTAFDGATTYSARLVRCGSRRQIRLGPYSRDKTQLGGGWVTWIKGRHAYALTLRSGARRRWSVPQDVRMLVHAAGRMYLLAGSGRRARLYSASLSKR